MTKRNTYTAAVLVAAVWLGVLVPAARGQPATQLDTAAVETRVDSLDVEPYRTERSLGAHVLAAPSYALHVLTRPVGAAVRWAEREFPELFEGELPPVGIYPLFETGGPAGTAGGLTVFHRDLFEGGHEASAQFLFGSRQYNRLEASYAVPDVFGPWSTVELRGRYVNDPLERYYAGGNASTADDVRFYAARQRALALEIAMPPALRSIGGTVDAQFERMRVLRNAAVDDDDDDEEPVLPLPEGLAGVGTANLFSIGVSTLIDWAAGSGPRTLSGTRVRLGWRYGRQLGGDRYQYGRYEVGVQQFIPLSFVPPTRRLAVRARLQRTVPLGGKAVPFYELSRLGSVETLRGYRNGRFRDRGALLFNIEYRYPIWEFWDAVLFFDEGQVFSDFGDLRLDRFRWSAGGGLHVFTGEKMAFRLEVAFSPEDVRTILSIRPLF